VLSAVFFTLVVVAGNTMMRSFRERIPELAVLKTLGFTDAKVAVLVGAEALLLCVGSGVLGLGLAWLILKPVSHAIAAVFPVLRMGDGVVSLGITFAFTLGVVSAVIPVWHSARLNIVAGLSRR
jgi:putative ABC transport system permease protein